MVLNGIMIRRLALLLSPCPGALQRAHDLKANSVEQDRAADRWPPRKQYLARFIADHHHGPLLCVIHGVQPAAFVDRNVTYVVKVGLHSHQLPAGLKKIADGANIAALDDWRRQLHVRDNRC